MRTDRAGRAGAGDRSGIWSEPRALLGADAVLVTHEHYDHVDELRLAGLGVPVYAPAEARLRRIETVGVRAGETFSAAGVHDAQVNDRGLDSLTGWLSEQCPAFAWTAPGSRVG